MIYRLVKASTVMFNRNYKKIIIKVQIYYKNLTLKNKVLKTKIQKH